MSEEEFLDQTICDVLLSSDVQYVLISAQTRHQTYSTCSSQLKHTIRPQFSVTLVLSDEGASVRALMIDGDLLVSQCVFSVCFSADNTTLTLMNRCTVLMSII
ncbi:unnamed protein product [Leuciscus chuanchicus]